MRTSYVVATGFLLLLLGAGGAWLLKSSFSPDFQQEDFRYIFSPDKGNARYFRLDLTTEINPADSSGTPTKHRLSGILQSEVTERDATTVKLTSSLLGVHQFNFDDANAISNLPENSNEARIAQIILQRGSSVMPLPGIKIPEHELRAGQVWQVQPHQVGQLLLPGIEYKVSHVDESFITLKFRSLDEQAEPSSRTSRPFSGNVTAMGYVQLERATGWPIRGRVHTVTRATNERGEVQFKTRIALERADAKPLVAPNDLFVYASDSLYTFLGSAYLPAFKVPDVPAFHSYPSPEESFRKLKETIRWRGLAETGGASGLDADLSTDSFETVKFHPIESVRLIGASGDIIAPDIPVNPRFNMDNLVGSIFFLSLTKVPFLNHGLTAEQLKAIDRIEIDSSVTVPDETIEVRFQPGDTKKYVEELELTLEVEKWTRDEFRLRIKHPDGLLPSQRPLIKTIPIGKDNSPIDDFKFRPTHTLFEAFRSPALSDITERPSLEEEQVYTAAITERILSLPPNERYGDWWHEMSVSGQDSIESAKVYLYKTKKEAKTIVAPSASPAIKDGKLSGERILKNTALPRLDFKELDINDVSINGVERNVLNVAIPGDDYDRCQVGLDGTPTYQGNPLSFSFDRFSDMRGHNLTTESRQKRFHDFSVTLNVDCITRVVMKTAPLSNIQEIEEIDPNTI